jgi:hypothetical protein
MQPLVQGERGKRPPRASLDGPMITPGLEVLSRGRGSGADLRCVLPLGVQLSGGVDSGCGFGEGMDAVTERADSCDWRAGVEGTVVVGPRFGKESTGRVATALPRGAGSVAEE